MPWIRPFPLRSRRKDGLLYGDQSLSEDCIRLLHIESRGNSLSLPKCSLRTYTADEAPEYDALSYHWGGEILGQDIRCNGHVIQIIRTLYDAIRRPQTPGV